MKQILQYAMILLCVTTNLSLSAQTDTTSRDVIATAPIDSTKPAVQFKIGTYYNSNLNYFGRTDSLRSSGFFPMAEVWFKDHFYINAAPVFVSNDVAQFQYAGTVATAGYMFNDQKRWAGNFFVVKPIYQDNSALVQSALKTQVAASLTFLNKIVNISGGGDIKWSAKTDYGATAGLDHIFRKQFNNKTILVVDPSAYLYAGTQQFSNTYYQQQGTIPLLPATEKKMTKEVKQFSILSYEFSAPVILALGKVQLIAIPAYVMPQNLLVVDGRPDLSERGEDIFYVTAGMKVSF